MTQTETREQATVAKWDVSVWVRRTGTADAWERLQVTVERETAEDAINAVTQSFILLGKETKTGGTIASRRSCG